PRKHDRRSPAYWTKGKKGRCKAGGAIAPPGRGSAEVVGALQLTLAFVRGPRFNSPVNLRQGLLSNPLGGWTTQYRMTRRIELCDLRVNAGWAVGLGACAGFLPSPLRGERGVGVTFPGVSLRST